MRASYKYSLIVSGISIVSVIILWIAGLLEDNALLPPMIYSGALLLGIFLALNEYKTTDVGKDFIDDLKTSLQVVGYFSIFIGIFTFLYYKYIDWEFVYDQIASKIDAATNGEITPENNPDGLTREEIIEKERATAESFISPSSIAFATFILTVITGFTYSIILTFIIRMNPKYKNQKR